MIFLIVFFLGGGLEVIFFFLFVFGDVVVLVVVLLFVLFVFGVIGVLVSVGLGFSGILSSLFICWIIVVCFLFFFLGRVEGMMFMMKFGMLCINMCFVWL